MSYNDLHTVMNVIYTQITTGRLPLITDEIVTLAEKLVEHLKAAQAYQKANRPEVRQLEANRRLLEDIWKK